MSVRRYAEGTTVAVETTQAEMRALLKKHGATHFMLGDVPGRQAVEFVLHGHRYRFAVDMPTAEWADGETALSSWSKRYADVISRKIESEWKRRWRARLLWLKATLEFSAGEGSDSLPYVLGAFAVLPDGRTLGQALSAGSIPLLGSGEDS